MICGLLFERTSRPLGRRSRGCCDRLGRRLRRRRRKQRHRRRRILPRRAVVCWLGESLPKMRLATRKPRLLLDLRRQSPGCIEGVHDFVFQVFHQRLELFDVGFRRRQPRKQCVRRLVREVGPRLRRWLGKSPDPLACGGPGSVPTRVHPLRRGRRQPRDPVRPLLVAELIPRLQAARETRGDGLPQPAEAGRRTLDNSSLGRRPNYHPLELRSNLRGWGDIVSGRHLLAIAFQPMRIRLVTGTRSIRRLRFHMRRLRRRCSFRTARGWALCGIELGRVPQVGRRRGLRCLNGRVALILSGPLDQRRHVLWHHVMMRHLVENGIKLVPFLQVTLFLLLLLLRLLHPSVPDGMATRLSQNAMLLQLGVGHPNVRRLRNARRRRPGIAPRR
mmetsp:Transcript_8898/g.25529  ORF Transcript_8898/g.25529 Transcript_8898/m.25529 type:complete len:389 (+) Transcript_8898:592-1758(+)